MKGYLFIFCIIFFSCSSTKITRSWREPNKQVSIGKLHKVLVVALVKDETNRRKVEDKMVEYLEGKGVVSYNYLDSKTSRTNEEAIRAKIKADGFDGAVTMRLLNVDQEKNYIPGMGTSYSSGYNNFSGYYYRVLPYFSNMGSYVTTKTYMVETNVFSILEDKIVWSGVTETADPDGVDKMIGEITKVVYKKMRSEGFISKN